MMVVASSRHWRRLLAVTCILMLLGFGAPLLIASPQIQENRKLAEWPAWPTAPAQFRDFRKGVDAYVADHFPARPHLISGLNLARLYLGVSGSDQVIVGRDRWLFYDDGSHLGAARDEILALPDARGWLAGLAGRTDQLAAAGVPYVVLVPPQKEAAYPQFGPYWYPGPDPRRPTRMLAAMAGDAQAGDVLYLEDAVAAATRGGVRTYTRYDTHWTGPGAYVAYAALMDRLHALGVAEAPRPFSDFSRVDLGADQPRDLAKMLGVDGFLRIDYPQFEDPAVQAALRVTYLGPRRHWTTAQVVDTGQAGKPVLLMNRDSFSNALLPFLYGHFSRVILAHNQDGAWRPDLIERYQPDIVVLEVLENGLRHSLTPSPPASPLALARIDKALEAYTPQLSIAPRNAPALASIEPGLRARLDAAPPAPCNLERASPMRDANSRMLWTAGWIAARGPTPGSSEGYIRLAGAGGDVAAPLRIDGQREDVAAFLKTPAAQASGFQTLYRLPDLPPGDYLAIVYRQTHEGWVACEGPRPVVLD